MVWGMLVMEVEDEADITQGEITRTRDIKGIVLVKIMRSSLSSHCVRSLVEYTKWILCCGHVARCNLMYQEGERDREREREKEREKGMEDRENEVRGG